MRSIPRRAARAASVWAVGLALCGLLGLATAASAGAAASVAFVEAPGSPYPAGGQDFQLEAADLNGDGRDDVVFTANPGAGAALAGPGGELTLLSGSPFAAPAPSLWSTAKDVNGDGVPDLVTANYTDDDASILLGDGKGGFKAAPGSPLELGAGTNPTSVAVGDFNGDGHTDLAFADCGSDCFGTGEPRVSVFLGDGHGHFSEAAGSPFPANVASPSTIAVADLNHDGEEDLIVGGESHVSVLLGDGKGGFEAAFGSPFSTGSKDLAYDLAVGDVNGDGNPDVVTANWVEDTVSVLLGNGHGQLVAGGPPIETGSGGAAQAVSIADLDANGTPDLVVANERNSPAHGDVSILLGDGLGNFSPGPGSPIAVHGESYFARVGDLNGDGQPDIAVANGDDETISVLLNQNSAQLTASPSALAFPRLALGGTSAEQAIALTDTGTGFMRTGEAKITGPQAGDFLIASDSCAGHSVLAGGTCTLGIEFRPSAGDTREALLEVPTNVPGASPLRVVVAGTGLATPGLSAAHFSSTRFTVAKAGRRSHHRHAPHGAALHFELSEFATVRVGVKGTIDGHHRGGSCHAKGRGRRCKLNVSYGHIGAKFGAGADKLFFSGVIAGHVLPPGSYTATITAFNDESISSTSLSLRFTILS